MFESEVERLFEEAADRLHEVRENPVTGGRWISGVDPIEHQKWRAKRALLAQKWFARTGPRDAPPLPLSYGQREALKRGGLQHLVAWYAEALAVRDYRIAGHPSFEEYASGVMASPYAPDFIKQDQELLKRFPPRPLRGLGPGLCFDPAK